MSQWQAIHVAFMVINGACCFVSAVALDRANAADDGWYHGSIEGWRWTAGLNAIAFGLNGAALAVFP